MSNDKLYVVRLSKELIVAGRDEDDGRELSLSYADHEEYKIDSIQQITAVEDVPETWLDSYPYSHDPIHALRTCEQYLNPPSEVEQPPTVRDIQISIKDFLDRYVGCVCTGNIREEIAEGLTKIINPQ